MDCDDVILLLAHDGRTLTGRESELLEAHVAECEECEELVQRGMRVPTGPLDIPVVDPNTFESKHVIAAGGMGQISSAIDRRLGRDVAIKEMLKGEQRERFEREVAITARLQHPAIVPVYEAGRWPDGNAFYTMRLVPGGTLGAALSSATTLARRLELLPHVVAVTDALAYAHSRGIIHRDLKPQNVLVGQFGETVVIDWGLARAIDDDDDPATTSTTGSPTLTVAGAIVGSPCFMAPEQARGGELDERTDVFALGALLYNLLSGAPPYWDLSHDSQRLIDAVLAQPPTPLGPDIPDDLRAIVERAMAREPRDRFANAGELAAELRRFQAGQLLVSREYRFRDLAARWFRRHRTLVLAGCAIALVAAVAIVGIARARQRADTAFESGEQRGQRKLCASELPQLASPWDAAARDLVHRQFATTKLPYVAQTLERVDAAFARWSIELATARESVCPAGAGDPPRAQLAAQLDCLHDRTREARTLISQLESADVAAVLNSIAASEQLAPITRCTTELPPRAEPVASPALADVRELFAKAHALMELGKFRAALPLAEQAVAAAKAIGDPGTIARAQVSLGSAQLGVSSFDTAAATLAAALRLADIAQDDRTRAQAWTNLVRVDYLRGHYAQAVAMRDAALGAAERTGDVWLQTEILLNLGGALDQLGKSTDAQPLYEQAVALRRKLYGARDHRLAFALSALGNAYAMQGNLDAAITAHREAVEIVEAALGGDHPNVGVGLGNLGSDYIYGLRAAEAVPVLERDLAIATAADGPKHRDVAMAMTDLGTAQLEAGQLAAAAETFERANTLWLELNAKHPARGDVLLGRYLALKGQGKPAATADLEAALVLAAAGLPPFDRARIHLALGLASTGAAAQQLVAAAAAGYATAPLPLCKRDLAIANAWLAAHPK